MRSHVLTEIQPTDFWARPNSLEVFFAPATVAVFGASETPGSVGRAVLGNLLWNPFGGTLFPITPKWSSVLGVKAYPSVAAVPMPVELAILATPAATIPDLLEECAAAGVKGAIILSDVFRDGDPARAALAARIKKQVYGGAMRVLGPNSMGVACSRTGFNATFAPAMLPPGSVGFISQSGSLLTGLTSGGLPKHVGCSAFISVGSMFDVGWADCLEYLGEDPQTEQIGIYAESLGDLSTFFTAVRKLTRDKPVILVRGGRTAAAAQAAASHSGSLTSRDEFLEEAFRRAGVLRVETIADLFLMAEMLATQPTPKGRRLAILSNGDGPAAVATDALMAEGGELAELAPETLAALDQLLPAHGSHRNPIDVGDDATPELFARAVKIANQDPNSDGVLIILTPQTTINPCQTAKALVPLACASRKLTLVSWLWGAADQSSLAVLHQAGIPNFSCPNAAVRAFGYLCRHGENLRNLSEVAAVAGFADEPASGRALIEEIVQAAFQSGRTLLTERECRLLLEAYSLPLSESRLARSEEEAVALAEVLGYPVTLKLQMETVGAGSELDAVQLSAGDRAAVRRVYRTLELVARQQPGPERFPAIKVQPSPQPGDQEIMLRSTTDPQLGPVIQLGAGGCRAGVPRKCAVALPPLCAPLVRQLLEQASLFGAFGAPCGSAEVNRDDLAQLLTCFSQLVVGEPWVKEIRLIPLLASPTRLVIVEAQAFLHGPEIREESLPRPPFALCHGLSEWEGPKPRSSGGVRGKTCHS